MLGRTGHSRLKRLLVGSVATHVARHATCPVALINGSTNPERKVTVAVDGSEHSISALVWALRLPANHEVTAVISHDEPVLDELRLDDAKRLVLDTDAETVLAHAVTSAADQCGVDASSIMTEVRSGDARTSIVDQQDDAGLLVLGGQGHSGMSGWMIGSLADYAVNHAKTSVVIWR